MWQRNVRLCNRSVGFGGVVIAGLCGVGNNGGKGRKGWVVKFGNKVVTSNGYGGFVRDDGNFIVITEKKRFFFSFKKYLYFQIFLNSINLS